MQLSLIQDVYNSNIQGGIEGILNNYIQMIISGYFIENSYKYTIVVGKDEYINITTEQYDQLEPILQAEVIKCLSPAMMELLCCFYDSTTIEIVIQRQLKISMSIVLSKYLNGNIVLNRTQ